VAQTIFTRQDLNKRTEVANARYDTIVDLADLNRCCASFNTTDSNACGFCVSRCDGYVSFIINIDGYASILLDSSDVLSARTNQCTDLLWIDLGS
jgi:hypothetical protein